MKTRLLLALALFLATAGAWMDPAWQYRTPITVNNAGSALTDFQVPVSLTSLAYNNTGLVGSWHFSEGTGTRAFDSSGNANDGTLTNGPVWTAGKFGNALSFDGVNDYVEISDSPLWEFGSGDFALEGWIYPQQAKTMILLGHYPGGGTGWNFYTTTTGTNNIVFTNGNNDRIWPYNFTLNNWYHVVLTRQGANLNAFVNGNQVGATLAAFNPTDASTPLRIGTLTVVSQDYYFNGKIDEVRIYNRSLSAQEISDMYGAGKMRLDYQDLRFTQQYPIYETPITVSGTGTALTDYQVLVNITNSTILSHMLANGSDLRFFGAQTASPYSSAGLPYWVESINSTQARVWVKMNVSAAGSTIYMYYGNYSAAPVGNGSAVFEFFDDFNDNTRTGWYVVLNNDAFSETNSRMQYSIAGGSDIDNLIVKGASSAPAFNFILEFRSATTGSGGYGNLRHSGWAVWTSGSQYIAYMNYVNGAFFNQVGYSFAVSQNSGASGAEANYRLEYNGSALNMYREGSKILGATGTLASAFRFGLNGERGGATSENSGWWDDFRVRKYAAVEPSATVGSESVKYSTEMQLNYWIESDSRAWVKSPYVFNGNNSVYAYYGNPSANGTGNASSVFIYFEGFDTSTSGSAPSGWSGSGVVASNAYSRSGPNSAQFATDGSTPYPDGYTTFPAQTTPFAAEFDALMTNIYSGLAFGNDGSSVSYPYGTSFFFVSDLLYNNKSSDYSSIQSPMTAGRWYHVGLEVDPTTLKANAYVNGIRKISNNTIQSGITSYNYVKLLIYTANGVAYVDNIYLRKYAPAGLLLSQQQEESFNPAVILSISPASRATYPSYNETFTLWIKNNQTVSDTFSLSCAGACSVSPPSLSLTPYQNGSATVTITSANVSGTTNYVITAISQANASNYASVSAPLTVDTTKWRDTWTDAYGNGFRYRVPITVTNGGNATLTDYQVNITIDTSTPIGLGRMRSDCGDIRVTNGTNEMPYWIESGCNTTSTKIWARVPYVPNGTSTVYAYYGSPSAARASNIKATFIVGDDFADSSIDTALWQTYGNAVENASGLAITGSGAWNVNGVLGKTTVDRSSAYLLEEIAQASAMDDGAFISGFGTAFSYTNGLQMYPYLVTTSSRYLDGASITWGTTSKSANTNWRFKILLKQTQGYTVWDWYNLDSGYTQREDNSAWTATNLKVALGQRYYSGQTVTIKQVTLRKYASPEPTPSLGLEQAASPAAILSILPSGKTTYPNYNETFTLYVYNNQTIADGFSLSCGACAFSENPVATTSYQNKSVTVTITSASTSGTTSYAITATSQANSSNFASVYASLTVDTTRWRSQWNDPYGNEFKYRIPITVTNGGNATLADFQVNVTLDTASKIGLNRMKGDCSDMRFTNGSNELYYWIDSGCNTNATKIWVRVPSIPVGSGAVYAYYGNNNAAGKSNGTAVFDFFDDFENYLVGQTIIGQNGWFNGYGTNDNYMTVQNDSASHGNKSLRGYSGSFSRQDAEKNVGISYDVIWEYDMRTTKSTGATYDWQYYNIYGSGVNFESIMFDRQYDGYGAYISTTSVRGLQAYSQNTWYAVKVAMKFGTKTFDAWIDGVKKVNNAAFSNTAASTLDKLGFDIYSSSAYGWFDNLRVRKYAAVEPAVLAGNEQTRGYRALVRRCGAKQPNANVSAYYTSNSSYANSCLADQYGICSLEISAGTYDLQFRFADNSTAWKNGTVFS